MNAKPDIIGSIRGEYRRYKALAEGAMSQLSDEQLTAAPSGGNSVAVICRHLAGNLRSRFTGFLTSDGEKPWRNREEEFQQPAVSRAELLATWEEGWRVLFDALDGLGEEHLTATVTIRNQPLLVHEALHRSLGHASYHVGQIVFLARSLRGDQWSFLSIPPGHSDAYNRKPTLERAADHAAAVRKLPDD